MIGDVEVNVGVGNPNQAESRQEADPNLITDFYNRGPISKFPILMILLCEIQELETHGQELAAGMSFI